MIATSSRGWGWQLGLVACLAMGGAIASSRDCALAQIMPDNTLGAESSVVTPSNIDGLPSERIDGGATRGANLFHSFQEFNIGEGRGAYFTNPTGIENILSRVTGGNVSNILGKLGVLGNANLFLINPNGIIFGPNASLDIRGSFLASTAGAVNFADGTHFSATAPQATLLLTVSVPLGLQYGGTARSILNQSRTTNSSGRNVGLQVQPGKTLALVGGDVALNRGYLFAPGGRVELGGVAGSGTVGLNVDDNNLRLSFPPGVRRANIYLDNGADVNVRAGVGGIIAINAQNLTIAGESRLLAGMNSPLSFIDAQGGNIEISVTEAINLSNDSLISNGVESGAVGNSGDINITTGSLALRNGSQLQASTSGQGDAGDVNIHAASTVSFGGVGSNNRASRAESTVSSIAVGHSGSVNIQAESLFVTDGAALVASTRGQGNAGDVNIYARYTVAFDRSAAFGTVERGATGNSGNINITTGSLFMTNGAALVASTRGQGNAGDVNINARYTVFDGIGSNQFNIPNFSAADIEQPDESSVIINIRDPASFGGEAPDLSPSGVLSQVELSGVGNAGNVSITAESIFVTNGAVLTASTLGQGDAGSLTINANTFQAESGGQVLTTTSSASNAGNIIINTAESITLLGSESGLFANTTPNSRGNGGSISINPIQLIIVDGAGIAVNSQGKGNAGNLTIQASSVTLDHEAFLSAAAERGKGGNISLDVQDLLLMRHNSRIFATSGSPENEGNITIDTDLLVALENSDIRADAFAGPGANIQITAQAIFGTQVREQVTLESDITATGVVELVTPDVDPSQGLVNLPAELVEASGLIATGCAELRENEFIVTGRGGLPPSPNSALNSDAVWEDWRLTAVPTDHRANTARNTQQILPTTEPLVEAQGWVLNDKGDVVLIASAPTVKPHGSWHPPSSCQPLTGN